MMRSTSRVERHDVRSGTQDHYTNVSAGVDGATINDGAISGGSGVDENVQLVVDDVDVTVIPMPGNLKISEERN